MSAPQTKYDQYPAGECNCQPRTVVRDGLVTWAIGMLAMLALATAIWAGSRPTEVAYYPSGGNTYGRPNPEPCDHPGCFDDQPVDSTTAKERKEFRKFLATGKADVKKWSTQNFDKSTKGPNVALAYLCMAKSTSAGRYYAASEVDDGADQDWGIYGGLHEGDPSATARQWCPSTPSWAQAEGKPLPKPGQPEEP